MRYFGVGAPKQFELTIGDGLDNTLYDEPLTFEFNFNPEHRVRRVHFDPPIGEVSSFEVEADRLRVHMVPDERRYALVLERDTE